MKYQVRRMTPEFRAIGYFSLFFNAVIFAVIVATIYFFLAAAGIVPTADLIPFIPYV